MTVGRLLLFAPDTYKFSGQLTLSNGSAAAPSLVFADSLTSGLFQQAAGVISLSLATVEQLRFSSATMAAQLAYTISTAAGALTLSPATTVTFPAGTDAAPSITLTGSTITGIYQPAVGQIGISIGGTGRYIYTSTDLSLFADLLPGADAGRNIGTTTFRFKNAAFGTGIIRQGTINSHATTAGTNIIMLGTGTAPVGTVTGAGSMYVATATNVELNYIDSGGNAQQLSTT